VAGFQNGDPGELVAILADWAAGDAPLYRQLADGVGRAVDAGDVQPGDRLPSERDLARLLAVSRATVTAAYDELRARGVVDSRRGSGTRISRELRPRKPGADGRVPGGQATSIFQRLVDGHSDVISLAFAVETAAPELGDALRDLVRDDLPHLLADLGYHPRGFPPLREAVAADFTAAGLPTVADQVLVTTGASQAISLVTQMYVPKGATVIVESPSWPGCLDVFRAAGARLVGVPLDAEGIRVEGVARALAEHTPALLYVMPTYHNPTGTLMSAVRRRQIADLAARSGVPVLEDNAYATYAGPGRPVPTPEPVAASAPEHATVLTLASLAKAVWGGLRIGWIRGAADTIERLARHKALADLGSPVLDQALAARLLPRLPELAAARADILSGRLDRLSLLLEAHLPDWRWRVPDGGSALWVELPDTDAQVFAQVALRHGVEVVPGSAMDPTGAHDTHIRLPFTFSGDTLAELVRRLSGAWAELAQDGSPARDPLRPMV